MQTASSSVLVPPASSPLRLAFCNATRKWGGVKTWTIEFAQALQARGHELFLYGRAGAFIERAAAKGLAARAINFGPDYNPVAIARFYREFTQRGIDLVLVNVGHDFRSAGIAARLAGIPLVQRIGLPGDQANSFSVRLLHRLLRPHYLCPCRYIADGMRANLPFIGQDEVNVVYSAKTPVAAPPGMVGTPRRLVTTSQVTSRKGHEELAHTLAALLHAGFSFHWNVVGEGGGLEGLQTLCAELGLGPHVTFHGFVQDVNRILQQNDIFVLPSYSEGLPNTLLEAMAHGLVPVARDVGGIRECWPEGLEPLLACDSGSENWRNLTATPEKLPLYTALHSVFSCSDETLLDWQNITWKHCCDSFSLVKQVQVLEDFLYTCRTYGHSS